MSEIMKEKDEVILHTTGAGIQQVKAKFLEDSRHISHLWFQRWNTKTDYPTGTQVVLYGEQISRLMEFLSGIVKLEIPHERTFNVNFDALRLVHLPDADARKVLEENPELVAEFARSKITTEDVVALAYRRKKLEEFRKLLNNGNVLEADWQKFFEQNKWIFGYGLAYVFTTGLDGGSLQATIRGASLIKHGKRPDGIMKTRAAISALCLVEIKKHSTQLLKKESYRPGTWAPTAELSGAVAQSQENVRVALDELGTYHQFTDQDGNPTGEDLMVVQPRSFLIIGNLAEFQSEHGVNIARYRSFEDYRRNLRQPEILTFDELYERARFIVENADQAVQGGILQDEEDIPF
ncbi:Shedu immune nuclease family protein [Pseudochelatococcus sp. B33]